MTLCSKRSLAVVFALLFPLTVPAYAELAAAVLPSARVTEIGKPVTVFATIINGSTDSIAGAATGCTIAPPPELPVHFSFQTTNPETNVVTGLPNQPVTIPANSSQSFVLLLEPWEEIASKEVDFEFSCENRPPARTVPAVNTLLLSATTRQTADVIALAVSASGTGIVPMTTSQPNATETGAFAVVAMNIGRAEEELVLSASTPTGAQLAICPTNPDTGECEQPPQEGVLATPMQEESVSTYSVFISTSHRLALDPERSRINVQFLDPVGQVRGATSLALASMRRQWQLWHDLTGGGSSLRLTGDIVAATPCFAASATVAEQQLPDSGYLNLDLHIVPAQPNGQACPAVRSNIELNFELPDYNGNYSGVVVRAPNRRTVIVDTAPSL